MAPKQINPGKALASAIDNGVFFVAALVLFLKTSEVLAIFAPASLFGYENTGWLYGLVCAGLVEGVLVAAKFTLPHNQTSYSWLYNVGLIAIPFAISAAAQVTDGFLVKETLSAQPAAIQFIVNIGVPLVPSVILALVLGKSIFQSMPEIAETKVAKITRVPATPAVVRQYAAEVAETELRKNDLTAEDKDFIATHNTRQILAKFGGSGRRARDWKNMAKSGKL
jgi:hypothetical protein